MLLTGAESQADECLARALDTARTQQARMLELRAATSTARLWKRLGRADDARHLLGPVYASFDQGLDTRDLLDAHALLQELSAAPGSVTGPGERFSRTRSPRDRGRGS